MVRECHNVTGSVEYLLRVEVPDPKDYKTFHADVLGTESQVHSITSYIGLKIKGSDSLISRFKKHA